MTETLDVLGAPMIIKSDGHEMAAFVADHPIPPGYFVPPHRHEADDEMLLVVDGDLTLLSESGESLLPGGAAITFRRGTLHGYRNDTKGEVRLIVVAAPGIQALEMFRHFDRAAKRAGVPLAPPDIAAIASEYGVTFG